MEQNEMYIVYFLYKLLLFKFQNMYRFFSMFHYKYLHGYQTFYFSFEVLVIHPVIPDESEVLQPRTSKRMEIQPCHEVGLMRTHLAYTGDGRVLVTIVLGSLFPINTLSKQTHG